MATFKGKVRLGEGVSATEGQKRMSGTEVPLAKAKITTSKSEPLPGVKVGKNSRK